MKKISVKMRDEYGNGAEQSKEFEVIQIPRQLILELKQKEIYPYESLEIVSTIFDQSENLMVLDVSYDISDFNHKLIESVEHFSGSEVIVNFLADTPPGNYSVIAEHNNLEAEDFFVIINSLLKNKKN